jgi:hypothetical protein
MAAILTTTAAPPGLARGERPAVPNGYFAIVIDAAVDLLEAREYQGLARADRLAKALAEQQGFLNGIWDPALRAVLDLRIIVDHQAPTPVPIALVGRAWGTEAAEVRSLAERLCAQLHASLPRHVSGIPVQHTDGLAALLAPLPGDAAVDAVMITRHERVGLPSRPDAGVGRGAHLPRLLPPPGPEGVSRCASRSAQQVGSRRASWRRSPGQSHRRTPRAAVLRSERKCHEMITVHDAEGISTGLLGRPPADADRPWRPEEFSDGWLIRAEPPPGELYVGAASVVIERDAGGVRRFPSSVPRVRITSDYPPVRARGHQDQPGN